MVSEQVTDLLLTKTNRAPKAPIVKEGRNMAENNDDDVPFMQKLLDILWGIIDIMNVPLAK